MNLIKTTIGACLCVSLVTLTPAVPAVRAEGGLSQAAAPAAEAGAAGASIDTAADRKAQPDSADRVLRRDLDMLYRDLTGIPVYGGTGGVGILGESAFPVSAPEGMASIGAARYGKGRIVLSGSAQYANLSPSADEAQRTLARNVLLWLTDEAHTNQGGGNDRTNRYEDALASRGNKKIRLATTSGSLAVDPALPIEVVRVESWANGNLNPQKVAVAYADGTMTEADAEALDDYVRRGGALIVAQNGRPLESITRSTPLEERVRIGNWRGARISADFPVQRLLNRAGLSLMNRELAAVASPTALTPEQAVNNRIRVRLEQGKGLEEGTLAIEQIDIGLPGAAPAKKRQLLTDVLTETLETITPETDLYAWAEQEVRRFGEVDFPIVKVNQPYRNALLNFEFSHFTLDPGNAKSPYADDFPGRVADDAPTVTGREVEVDLDFPEDVNYSLRLPNKNWVSTGLYAPPGKTVTLEVPAGTENVSVQIGSTDDDLRGSSTWNRVPLLVHFKKLTPGTVQVSSPYGGMIYLIPMKPTAGKTVTVTISGAVQAPYYELGKTTAEQWDAMRGSPATPYAELKSERIVLTVPSEFIRELTNPEELMKTWDDIVDSYDGLSGQSPTAPLPHTAERYPRYYVVDRQISSGALHAGYPIMAPFGAGKDLTNLDYIKTKAWGYWHELGHEYQQSAWTWGDVGEVTVNIYSLFIQEKYGNPSELLKTKNGKTYYQRAIDFLESADPNKKYGQLDNYDRLVLFKQLQMAYGWPFYTRLFAHYREMPKEERPGTNQQQIDTFAVTASKLAGEDLTEFFVKWSVGLSDEGKARIRAMNLPQPQTPPWTLRE
ncbi:M60 family metallopeptidase [Paenibacillus flagellatus]|uniref:Peptidase M60 domain-containing protein n=1 Tax=Paenibacillus flagellatus TaxID=2211139 RepID=A0A2V5K1D0_9BACL|nr:M60 family metallopeptidase [Paenibacillus flagellatus]PYI51524.1 hypothetical protein DLM86_24185 [Paenibacillus flagellatus]